MNKAELQAEIRARDETIRRQAKRIADLEAKVDASQKEIADLKTQADGLRKEIVRLNDLLNAKAKSKDSKKPSFNEDYSLSSHESKRSGKGKRKKGKKGKKLKKSTGRRPQSEKDHLVKLECNVYWPGAEVKACVLRRQQCAWRYIDGKAVYVRYNIFDLPESKQLPLPLGLRNSRSEFGIEIIVSLAFLHYWVGMSIDNALLIFSFFSGLSISKAQTNSLMNQLAADWEGDYDAITELIAVQLIIYVDETGWKIGKHSCYTWAFSCASYVLFRCGVGRGKDQAEAILGSEFAGIGVSDDYGVYKKLFKTHQLCWAHLLRKAIKLALQNPDQPRYAEFLDELYEIYRRGVAYQKDRRLSVGRKDKVEELCQAIADLCSRSGLSAGEAASEAEATWIRLQNELVDNLDCLFVFVACPEVEATNNFSERIARHEAEIRKGGRTSKSENGARRRSVILTVFASLRTRIDFTLQNVIAEINRWLKEGCSIFRRERAEMLASIDPTRAGPSGTKQLNLSNV